MSIRRLFSAARMNVQKSSLKITRSFSQTSNYFSKKHNFLGLLNIRSNLNCTNNAPIAIYQRCIYPRFGSSSSGPKQDESSTENNSEGAAAKTTTEPTSTADKKEVAKFDPDEYDDYYDNEEPQTAKEKAAFWAKVALRWAFLLAALGCLYLFIKEVFPGRMSANSLFSEVFDLLQGKDDIKEVVGSPMKAYGRDVGRSEGRRNHVDSYKYSAPDGSERMRVRFHVEGPRGKIRVWAEVSDKMLSTEFVYVVCQTQSGRVITVVDNRDTLDAEQNFGGGSKDSLSAIKALLGGSGQGK